MTPLCWNDKNKVMETRAGQSILLHHSCELVLITAFATMEDENIYDEIEIEDMTFDADQQLYHYPCPCGDRFQICIDDLRDGQDIAVCPSCSLMIRVIFEAVSWGK